MWDVKAEVIPVIMGRLEPFHNHSKKILSNIPGKYKVKQLQKQPYWALTHTTECANVKVQNIIHGGNKITCNLNCKYRTAATLCTLNTWFVSGI
jgi:hypothetical protein